MSCREKGQWIVVILLTCILAGCSSEPDFVLDEEYEVRDVKDQMVKPELPKYIVDKTLGLAPTDFKEKGIISKELPNHLKRATVHVYLNEERGEVFGGRNQKLIMEGGAGEIDLAQLIQTEAPTSFYFGVHLVKPETDNYHIYFYNEGKRRNIDGVEVGLECGEYVDLKDINKRIFQKDGLLALTGDQRHVTLLAGIYYIIAFEEGEIYVSHFRIKDSRFPDLSCVR